MRLDHPPETEAILALVDVAAEFERIASALRALPGVRSVRRWCWMYREGPPECVVAWSAEAEFLDDRLLAFRQELSWYDGEWLVEAWARGVSPAGADRPLLELPPRRAATALALGAEARCQARLLAERVDAALIRLPSTARSAPTAAAAPPGHTPAHPRAPRRSG